MMCGQDTGDRAQLRVPIFYQRKNGAQLVTGLIRFDRFGRRQT